MKIDPFIFNYFAMSETDYISWMKTQRGLNPNKAIHLSDLGFDFPLVAYIAQLSVEDPIGFKISVRRAITDLEQIKLFFSIAKNFRKGFGRSVKTAINYWIDENVSALDIVNHGKIVANVIKVTRKRSTDPMFHWAMGLIKNVNKQKLRIYIRC